MAVVRVCSRERLYLGNLLRSSSGEARAGQHDDVVEPHTALGSTLSR